jgi:fatty acid desaturase
VIDRVNVGAGIFFVLAGLVFLLDGLEVISVGTVWLWPLLLIAAGVALVLAGRRGHRD